MVVVAVVSPRCSFLYSRASSFLQGFKVFLSIKQTQNSNSRSILAHPQASTLRRPKQEGIGIDRGTRVNTKPGDDGSGWCSFPLIMFIVFVNAGV